MNLTERDNEIIGLVLRLEHFMIASKLGFLRHQNWEIDYALLLSAVGLIDKLSRFSDEESKRIGVTLCSIIWSYRKAEWDGLKDFLVLVLSRMGFSPSAIMVDEDYDPENMRFSPLRSILDQFSITYQQLRFEVTVDAYSFLLTEFQMNVWKKMDEFSLLGISAPTSAGKSFVLLLKCMQGLLHKPGNVVYIVPTLSLVFQVSVDFRKALDKFGLKYYEILTSYYERPPGAHAIYVLTQEKAIAAFSQKEKPFEDLRYLIADEIQNVERVADEGEQRAKTLFDALIEFRHATKPDKTVISGPRIESIGELGVTIFGSVSGEEQTKGSPVVNLTYAVSKVGKNYYFKQYTDIRRRPSSIPIQNAGPIDGHGRVQYRKKYHGYLFHIISNLGQDSCNIIFAPTSGQARRTALALTEITSRPTNERDGLIKYVSETIHPKYDLCATLRKGIAYHHGKTPPHVRRAVERAIRDSQINNVVCTTTLMQGVNLPAQNVIIRNPYLYVSSRHGKPKLTNYEIANLRGRAGRLLKDFIGRTFVLDENSFEDTVEQTDLFAESTKELRPGYGEKFEENENEVLQDLLEPLAPQESNHEYSYLLTYIRQIALKYGSDGRARLRTVGIEISETDYGAVVSTLKRLTVPLDVCTKNRYWDPFDLDRLYADSQNLKVPNSASESGIAWTLLRLLKHMSDGYRIYTDRFFPEYNESMLKSNCINAEHWLKEWPLSRILNSKYFDNSDKIEKTINTLQNRISFGLPMLLKPIYDIKNSESMFLRFIELGAFNPVTRRMIEMNVPRETAISLTNRFFDERQMDSDVSDSYVRDRLRKIVAELSFWDQIQLESVL